MDPIYTDMPRPQAKPENVLNAASLHLNIPLITSLPRAQHPAAIAISIVTNSYLLSEGLFALLSLHLSLRLIGTYSGEVRISSPLPNPQGHVVLLDSSVGYSLAIAWTRYWHTLIPPAYVLILELANDSALILGCIEAGATGYTLQGASALEVVKAISDASHGEAHCSPEITAQLYARVTSLRATVTQLSASPLTQRETEILNYVATGYTNQEIATQLVIEIRTVKQHVHNILRKLNSRNRGEAARLAADQGWLGAAAACVPQE